MQFLFNIVCIIIEVDYTILLMFHIYIYKITVEITTIQLLLLIIQKKKKILVIHFEIFLQKCRFLLTKLTMTH